MAEDKNYELLDATKGRLVQVERKVESDSESEFETVSRQQKLLHQFEPTVVDDAVTPTPFPQHRMKLQVFPQLIQVLKSPVLNQDEDEDEDEKRARVSHQQ